MNEYDWDYQEDDDDEGPVDPKSLPKQLRKVIANAKKAEKEARDETAVLRKQVRESNIASVLTSRNVPAKVAKLIPADIEPSTEAIEKWLTDFGDVFSVGQSAPPAATGSTPPTGGQAFINNAATSTGPSPEEIAALQRMQGTAATALPFGGRMDELKSLLESPDLTEERLDALISKGGL